MYTMQCEFEATYPDEWGLACSEPGIPTSYIVTCDEEATVAIVLHDPDVEFTMVLACSDHLSEMTDHYNLYEGDMLTDYLVQINVTHQPVDFTVVNKDGDKLDTFDNLMDAAEFAALLDTQDENFEKRMGS